MIMQDNEKKPALRFKGFTDPWEQRKLKELYFQLTERNADLLPYQKTLSVATMSFRTDGNGAADTSLANYKRLRTGDIAFEGHTSKEFRYGRFVLNDVGDGIMSPRFSALRPLHEMPINFWKYYIHYEPIMRKVLVNSTKAGTMMNELVINEFLQESILVPSVAEQQAIGRFFKQLDTLITLHQRKYEKLVNIKKSMLDKMFPQNGASVPEIRFKGFTDPWEQRKFSELVQIERGGSPRPIDDFITDAPNGLNWVKIGDAPTQENYITKTAEKIRPEGLSKTREVHPGDLILSNSMSFGKPYIMGIDGCIHDGWLLIRNTYGVFDLTFLCHLLGTPQMLSQYRSLAAGSTVNNLNKELVGNTVVTIPSITEQRVLGDYLEQLDNLITLHQRKLEKLQNIKKSCLEKMFV